jgi:hypothetical protein
MINTCIFTDDPSNIYVNASLFNNTDQNIPCQLETTLTQPILQTANKYKMCVVRFDIPLDSVQKSIMTTVMSTLTFSAGLMYNGQTSIATASQQQLSSMNTMTDFVYYLNELINTAFSQLVLALGPMSLQSGYTPYFSWDPTTHLLSIAYSQYFISNNIYIILSQSLFNVIGSFPYYSSGTKVNGNTVPNGYVMINSTTYTWNQAYIDNGFPSSSSTTTPSGSSYNAIKITQEYNTTYNFNNVDKVVLLTSLPIRGEFLPNSGVVNAGSTSAQTSSRIILTDYDVPINYWGDLNQTLYYIPATLDRWVDIITNQQLDRISFNFQYEDTLGNLNQLYLSPFQRANIKLLFRQIV